MICHSPKAFAEKLDLLIQRADLRRTIAENAYRYVAEHRLLDQHIDTYIAAYRELMQRREELERARSARVEKFFQLSLVMEHYNRIYRKLGGLPARPSKYTEE